MKTARAGARRVVKDESLHIIQNARRRAFLRVLRELGGEACLREIARRVAERERTNPVRSVRVSMLQTHIPKMESAGLIEYDQATDTVHLLEFPPEFRYHLEVVERHDIPWSLYYLLLSAFGGLLSLFLGNFLACLLSASFLVGALYHTLQTYGLSKRLNESLHRVKQTLTKSA